MSFVVYIIRALESSPPSFPLCRSISYTPFFPVIFSSHAPMSLRMHVYMLGIYLNTNRPKIGVTQYSVTKRSVSCYRCTHGRPCYLLLTLDNSYQSAWHLIACYSAKAFICSPFQGLTSTALRYETLVPGSVPAMSGAVVSVLECHSKGRQFKTPPGRKDIS